MTLPSHSQGNRHEKLSFQTGKPELHVDISKRLPVVVVEVLTGRGNAFDAYSPNSSRVQMLQRAMRKVESQDSCT